MTPNLDRLRKAPGIIRLHGHRGARGIWPENTLTGFQGTFDLGVQVVELDVLLTKDNIPVITHNPTLMPETTRGPDAQWLTSDGPHISDLSIGELCSYDIGGMRSGTDYAQRYPEQAFMYGQRVPTLDALAKLVLLPKYVQTWLNIEIKSNPIHEGLTPPPEQLAAQVAKVIKQNQLDRRVIVQSFDWRVLEHIKRIAPHLPRSHLTFLETPSISMDSNIYEGSPWMAGATTTRADSDLCDVVAEAGGQLWAPFHMNVDAEEVARAQAKGLIVNAWTVNEITDIDRMIDAGVDGIISDYPARVQRRLIERGYHWREDFAELNTAI
jgi:glycerophosphoryl diester phosphodiesterase